MNSKINIEGDTLSSQGYSTKPLSADQLQALNIIADSDFFVKALFCEDQGGEDIGGSIETDVSCIISVRNSLPKDISLSWARDFQNALLNLDYVFADKNHNLSYNSLRLLKDAAICECFTGLLINDEDSGFYGLEIDTEPVTQLRICYAEAAGDLKTAEAMLEGLRADLRRNGQ